MINYYLKQFMAMFFLVYVWFFSFSSLEGKPLCYCYGNCQMDPIFNYLKKNHGDIYRMKLTSTYHVQIFMDRLDFEKLKEADIFIYHEFPDAFGSHSTNYIKKNCLKSSCLLINVPMLGFTGIFQIMIFFLLIWVNVDISD